MSLTEFERRMARMDLSDGDRKWFPKWLAGYAEHGGCDPTRRLPIVEDRVIGFLRSLRDSHVAAWRRLRWPKRYASSATPRPSVDAGF